MPTLTIRNVPPEVVRELKARARRNHRSVEQQVRDLLRCHTEERRSVLDQIRAAWSRQTRRPSSKEVQSWIEAGRE